MNRIKKMLYVQDARGSVEEVVEKLEGAVAENHFGVLGIHDLKQKLNAKGVPFETPCRILEVCNPSQAKVVLEGNMAISTALPCRISVYEKEGMVKVAMLKPTVLLAMFEQPDLERVAKEVEETMIRIIDTACR